MAQILPENFPQQPSRALPNFDFLEFTSGKGYVTFYLYTSYETGNLAVSGGLTTNSGLFSHNIYDKSNEVNPMTFDTDPFNRTLIVDGDATMVLPVSVTTVHTSWFSGNISKLDSSAAETILVNFSGGQVVSAAQKYKVTVIKADIPRTIIKPNERLRLKLFLLGTGGNLYLGHDPADRDTGLTGATPFGDDAIASAEGRVGTKSLIFIPFDNDLT